MKPYSQDLREKIIAVLEADEETQSEVADNFGVSLSFVEKLWRRWSETSSCAALPRAGGRQRTLKDEAERLREAVATQPDATLSELCAGVAEAGGASSSLSMMCRELQH